MSSPPRAARSSVRPRPRPPSSGARRSRRTSWRATACRPRRSASASQPTRRWRRFDAESSAIPLVLKADGLAAGKGVVIAEDAADGRSRRRRDDDRSALRRRRRAASCSKSFSSVRKRRTSCSPTARTSCQLGSAQDHKRIFDDDRGPNTGGMGAFAPSPLMTRRSSRRVCDEIVSPGARRHGARRTSVSRVPLRRSDAHGRRTEGDRVQRPLRRSRSAGRAADAR